MIAAADAKIGYPPTRVWGVPAAGLWAHRLGDQRAKRLLFTGDSITGAQAAEWGLAVEAPDAKDLDERTERLVERIAAVPVNQLIMVKLALNSALLQQGVATSRMVSTVFDGIARHTPEGTTSSRTRSNTASVKRCATATSRSAITADVPPGCRHGQHDGPLGGAQCPARRSSGVGDRE